MGTFRKDPQLTQSPAPQQEQTLSAQLLVQRKHLFV